jgi:acetylornithine deacetylase/succinyl-diaminopimelate desuccinylase-like protein
MVARMSLPDVLELIDQSLDDSIARLLDLIAIPSVSSDPPGSEGIAQAADWSQRGLAAMGFVARVVPTDGHPVVLAQAGAPGPSLLFYGHYDVQPVGDLADWKHPPFAPKVIEEDGLRRFYGRGASDSKGQLWAFVEGLRAWKAVHGSFPGRVTVILEGEEECGSPSLAGFLARHRTELASDVAFICDSDMWSRNQPALTTQLKGLVHERLTLHAPNPDLHSGHWGAVVVNPIRVLAGILAGLHDAQGRVTIAGFYEGVTEIPAQVRAEWAALAGDPSLFDGIDLRAAVAEAGYSAVEAMWGRPTLDFNGVTAGNQGPGGRSVLPGSATVRLTFRLVGGQEPEAIREKFRAHVTALVPEGCRAEFEGSGGCAASVMPMDNPFIRAVSRGLQAEWERPVVLKGSGGAIPFVQELNDQLGVDCILIGSILGDDAIHAPDERYDVERFHKSVRGWARILEEIRLGWAGKSEGDRGQSHNHLE